MALSRPRWVSTWATAATSPIHDGVEGTDVGLTWIVTEGCVILLVCPPFWETVIYIYSLTRRHISSVLSSFPHGLLSYAISLRISWGKALVGTVTQALWKREIIAYYSTTVSHLQS